MVAATRSRICGCRSCRSPPLLISAIRIPDGWHPGSLKQSRTSPSQWMGCVMARTAMTGATNGDDFNDKTTNTGTTSAHSYTQPITIRPLLFIHRPEPDNKKVTNYYVGDNDWQPSTWTSKNNEPDASNNVRRPESRLPSLPILPETASKTTSPPRRSQSNDARVSRRHLHQPRSAGRLVDTEPKLARFVGFAMRSGGLPLAYNTPYMKKGHRPDDGREQ